MAEALRIIRVRTRKTSRSSSTAEIQSRIKVTGIPLW